MHGLNEDKAFSPPTPSSHWWEHAAWHLGVLDNIGAELGVIVGQQVSSALTITKLPQIEVWLPHMVCGGNLLRLPNLTVWELPGKWGWVGPFKALG